MAVALIDQIRNRHASITLEVECQSVSGNGVTFDTGHSNSIPVFRLKPGEVRANEGQTSMWIAWSGPTWLRAIYDAGTQPSAFLDVNQVPGRWGWDYVRITPLHANDGPELIKCGSLGNANLLNYSHWTIELGTDGRLVLTCTAAQGLDAPTGQSSVLMSLAPIGELTGHEIIGVGTDHNLYVRQTMDSSWMLLPQSGPFTGVAVVKSRRIFAIGRDQRLYKQETLNSRWTGPWGSGAFLAITAKSDGLLGVGTDKNLYTIDTVGNHAQVENSGDVTVVAVTPDGFVWGIRGQQLYKRATLNSGWTGPLGSGAFLAITGMVDGSLLGVGTDHFLYTIDTTGNHKQIPNSGSVIAVSHT